MSTDFPSVDDCLLELSRFLKENNYPEKIRWITSRGIIFTGKKIYITPQDYYQNEMDFKKRYLDAGKIGLGIKLSLCSSDGFYSYCYFYIPDDKEDMDRLLLNRSPKFGLPSIVIPATHIQNPIAIIFLRLLEINSLRWKSTIIT